MAAGGSALCIKYRLGEALGEAGRWPVRLMISALSFTEQSEHFYMIFMLLLSMGSNHMPRLGRKAKLSFKKIHRYYKL